MSKVHPITDKAQLRMMAAILINQSYRNYLLFAMGCNLGLRISDYISMTAAECREICNKKKVNLVQLKTKKPVYFEVPDDVHEIMLDYISGMDDNEYLFKSRKLGWHISEHRAWEIIWEAAQEAGVTQNIGCHSLRKTFGYFHYQKNKNIRILMEIFQHATEEITLRYIGVIQEDIDESMKGLAIGTLSAATIKKAREKNKKS